VHLDEHLPHDEDKGNPIVYQSLGHLVLSDRELDHEGQVLIGELYLWMIFGPNEISILDHIILLPSSMH
jgi:hypothetical protein